MSLCSQVPPQSLVPSHHGSAFSYYSFAFSRCSYNRTIQNEVFDSWLLHMFLGYVHSALSMCMS